MIAIILSKVFYSNNFFIIVHITKTGDLNVDITNQESDDFDSDPLSKYLKHAPLNV